jgi:alpha-1,6-mannosyltransferase
MRIVDVNEFYSPTGGGVRTYLDRKMGIMADMGHELIVVAPALEDSIEERPGGGKHHLDEGAALVVDRNYGIFVKDEPIWNLLDELKPDVVETSSPWRPPGRSPLEGRRAQGLLRAWRPDRRLSAALARQRRHADPGRAGVRLVHALHEQLPRHYDALVTNGPALAKRFRRRGMHVDASMPLGIERSWFSPDLRDEKLRVALLAQLRPAARGAFAARPGAPPQGKALAAGDRRGRGGGERLAGRPDPDRRRPAAPHLEQRIAGSPHIRIFRPVYDRVRFSRIMASCDALIHGSDAEPFGLVASEALASGLPLIGPDEGGFAEIADPLFAETYAARDTYSAADAIRRMFAREQSILRNAARVAAGKVRSDDRSRRRADGLLRRLAGGEARRRQFAAPPAARRPLMNRSPSG